MSQVKNKNPKVSTAKIKLHLQQDKAAAGAFLKILGPNDDQFTFQTFDDNADRKAFGLTRMFHGTFDEHYNELVRLNEAGAGIFFTVNSSWPLCGALCQWP